MDKLDPYWAPLGRLLLSIVFILAGLQKIMSGGAGMEEYMGAAGVPFILFWPAAIFEFVAGIMILAGFKTRIIAFLLAGFCVMTAFLFHMKPENPMEMALMLKNLAMAGGFLLLVRFGAGEMSMDNRAASDDA